MSARARPGSAYRDAKDGSYRPWRDSVAISGTLAALTKWQREPDLFADMVYPNVPGARREETSREAAAKIAPNVSHLRKMVLDCLGDHGAKTPDECAATLGIDFLSIRPRFSELARLGLIVKTGERRPNRSGAMANVWRAPS